MEEAETTASLRSVQARLRETLRCPSCHGRLDWSESLTCERGHQFALRDGVPILTVAEETPEEAHQHAHQQSHYDQEYGAYHSYHLENWQRSYVERLAPLWSVSGPQAPFLDAGVGGSAYTVIEAARAGLPAVGCDLSHEGMLTARRLAEAEGVAEHCLFVVCSAERLPFADGVFGGVAAIAVLEHVPDDGRAIAELARVVRRGGRIFLAVPNSLERIPFSLRKAYQWHDRRIGHLRHYSSRELIERAKAAGLQPIKTTYSAHWIKVWQLVMHLIARRLRVPDDRLWARMEAIDQRLAHRDNGMHLNAWLERPSVR